MCYRDDEGADSPATLRCLKSIRLDGRYLNHRVDEEAELLAGMAEHDNARAFVDGAGRKSEGRAAVDDGYDVPSEVEHPGQRRPGVHRPGNLRNLHDLDNGLDWDAEGDTLNRDDDELAGFLRILAHYVPREGGIFPAWPVSPMPGIKRNPNLSGA